MPVLPPFFISLIIHDLELHGIFTLYYFYTTTKDTESQDPRYSTEENQQFKEIFQKIISFNIEIEIIGCWIWCFNCYGYKDRLKELGFRWASKKKAWIWHADPYRRHHNKEIPLEEIREKYGVQKVRKHNAQTTLADTLLS